MNISFLMNLWTVPCHEVQLHARRHERRLLHPYLRTASSCRQGQGCLGVGVGPLFLLTRQLGIKIVQRLRHTGHCNDQQEDLPSVRAPLRLAGLVKATVSSTSFQGNEFGTLKSSHSLRSAEPGVPTLPLSAAPSPSH
jgi:hypothetical protein